MNKIVFDDWLAVSTDGFASMNAGREPAHLVKELVQNCAWTCWGTTGARSSWTAGRARARTPSSSPAATTAAACRTSRTSAPSSTPPRPTTTSIAGGWAAASRRCSAWRAAASVTSGGGTITFGIEAGRRLRRLRERAGGGQARHDRADGDAVGPGGGDPRAGGLLPPPAAPRGGGPAGQRDDHRLPATEPPRRGHPADRAVRGRAMGPPAPPHHRRADATKPARSRSSTSWASRSARRSGRSPATPTSASGCR